MHAGLIGPYLAGALSHDGQDYGTPLITLGAFVLAAAVMLFGAAQPWTLGGHNGRRCAVLPAFYASAEGAGDRRVCAPATDWLHKTGVLQMRNSTNLEVSAGGA